MQEALGLILSVFAVVALGGVLGRTRLFGDATVTALNNFVWHVAIPALMFRTMATNPLPGTGELTLVALYYAAALSVYAFIAFSSGLLFRVKPGERAVLALSGCFANGMMLGVPIISGAYGPEGLHLLFILIAFHGPIFVTVSTVLVELERNPGASLAAGAGRSGKALLRQTPLVALALGLVAAALGLEMPGLPDRILATLGDAVIPCGLFAVGASLSHVEVRGDLPQAGLSAVAKLLLMPAAVLLITRIAGVPPLWSAVATTMAALPTGVVAFNFAAATGIAPRRVATAFFLANVAAVASLTFWVGWLKGGV